VVEKYKKEIKLVIKNFPLPSHKFARKAATAALAARKQGKFWEFHEKLYENYKNINDAKVKEIARSLDIDFKRLNEDMKDPEIQKIINRDINGGREIGVRGTPTIFINGKRLQNRSFQGFQWMIEAELKKKG
jgi:protein-disulfide isomerase